MSTDRSFSRSGDDPGRECPRQPLDDRCGGGRAAVLRNGPLGTEPKAGGPHYVLLVGAPDDGIGRAVAHLTGARVDVWTRTDGTAGPWVVDDVVAAVSASDADAVTVVAGPAGLETVGMQKV